MKKTPRVSKGVKSMSYFFDGGYCGSSSRSAAYGLNGIGQLLVRTVGGGEPQCHFHHVFEISSSGDNQWSEDSDGETYLQNAWSDLCFKRRADSMKVCPNNDAILLVNGNRWSQALLINFVLV